MIMRSETPERHFGADISDFGLGIIQRFAAGGYARPQLDCNELATESLHANPARAVAERRARCPLPPACECGHKVPTSPFRAQPNIMRSAARPPSTPGLQFDRSEEHT